MVNNPTLYTPIQCTTCGKYKVVIDGVGYVTNGRIVSEDIEGLYVYFDENNDIYFSITRHPYSTEKWKIINKQQLNNI